MQVMLDVPEELAQAFGGDRADLTRAALEALVLQSLRMGKLTEGQARRLLGFASRYEMDGFLKSHGFLLPLTEADVERDAAAALSHAAR